MGIVEQYLLQLNTEKQRFRRVVVTLTLLSLLVVAVVGWNLRLTGVTLANDASCGITEHKHTDECPVQKTLACGYPEVPEETESEVPSHIHGDDCYETVYVCGMEEHLHAVSCYSDITADKETAEIWAATVPVATGQWAQDLALVAQSQLGCGESESNFVLADDGETRNGITRYGQWYGNDYGDWSSMFVMFCLNYANVPQDAILWSPGVNNMMLLNRDKGIVSQPDAAMGAAGDILFLDTDGNGNADRSLIVTAVSGEILTAIGGDWDNAVSEIVLSKTDVRVLGYIGVDAVQNPPAPEPTPEPAAAPESTAVPEPTVTPEPASTPEPEDAEESAEPAIILEVEIPEEEDIICLFAQTVNIDDTLYLWQWQASEDGNEPWTDIEGADCFYFELPLTEENGQRYYRIQGRVAPPESMTFAIIRQDTGTVENGNTITSGTITPFSLDQNNSGAYTVDIYAYPVNENGERIQALEPISLGNVVLNSATKIEVSTLFDASLGDYVSAFFGTRSGNSINVATGRNSFSGDNLRYIWRYTRFTNSHYIAVENTYGSEQTRWKSGDDANTSLYLRYRPQYTVTFTSDGFDPVTERVYYNQRPQSTIPGTWSRDGYNLLGWTVDGDEQNVYTYEQIMARAVTANVTYEAKWQERAVTITYDLGDYADLLYPISAESVRYGNSKSSFPTPAWQNNTAAMAFDGWYLDEEFTQPVATDHKFYEDTTLYAKWIPKEDGYFVYFMDFEREDQIPLVLMTHSVTKDKTTAPFAPGDPPVGLSWDGKWYLDPECTKAYDFRVPVSQMTEYLAGEGRDLYLYPGTQSMHRAIFVTYGTKIDPVEVPVGEVLHLDQYIPTRYGYEFAGWALKDGTPVSGDQILTENTTYYALWNAGYVPFEAILRIENPNDTGMTQADILGTWYAKAGSQIRVNSTYTGSGDNRTGTHRVVCVLDGVEYPVYTDAALTRQATLADVYNTYFLYNNAGTGWTDEVNWDDVYTGGELPYSTRPISSAGDTIINFDYMRVRSDISFTIPNSSNGAYLDVYKLYNSGLITGSVTYTDTTPTREGQNVSATGVSGTNIHWSYRAATTSTTSNTYTLHNIKYGQRIYEDYPVGGSWLTVRNYNFHWYKTGTEELFASRREDASADFFEGTGRGLKATSLTAIFASQNKIGLMYAIECLEGETADFTINGVGYKVQPQLCEVVNHTGTFSQKDLYGCVKTGSVNYQSGWYNNYVGNTSLRTLFGVTYWELYDRYVGVDQLSDINRVYVFYYDRYHLNLQFNFAYDVDGNGANETVQYDGVSFGERIEHYQFGAPDFEQHPLLNREGYEFVGWLDANGFVLEADDWASMEATGDSESGAMIFVAKWEKISNNIVEYYEDVSAPTPFEIHYFDDGDFLPYPTMMAYPQGWVWKEYGQSPFVRFDWDVPMYGEYGVKEVRTIQGEERVVNVIRIYGTWDESHTKVVYDSNPAQGGIPGTAPIDPNEYTIWQSQVPIMSKGATENMDPKAVFVGWLLDRNGIVYQPGDHVAVQWPRTMIFTAQWATPEEVVHLRYDPNGGTPDGHYPHENGLDYRKGATASVWDNTGGNGSAWFSRTGYTFLGWNTMPDGSGTDYPPGSNIQLTEPMTTLYAQWQRDTYRFQLRKVDYEDGTPLSGAVFELYQLEEGEFLPVETLASGSDGYIAFADIQTGVLYKLVEARPPGGYAILAKEVHFRLHPHENTVRMEFCDAEGNVISIPKGVEEEYLSEGRQLMLTVQNVAGFELPSTGGMGMYLYILCGVILMTAPFVYILRLRRRCERRAKE